jgi:hypothetical protein
MTTHESKQLDSFRPLLPIQRAELVAIYRQIWLSEHGDRRDALRQAKQEYLREGYYND